MSNHAGPSLEVLQDKRRRLSRTYYDGGFSEDEYNRRLAEIDRQFEQFCVITPPAIEEAEELFSNIPMFWNEATPQKRARLLSPLIEMVYMDIENKLVTAFKPAPAFRSLFGAGLDVTPCAFIFNTP